MPVLWYRDPVDQVLKPYDSGGNNVAGKLGYAGASYNTDSNIDGDSNWGIPWETIYGTPTGMTPIPYATVSTSKAGCVGTRTVWTIQNSGWYDIRFSVDVGHGTTAAKNLFVMSVYVDATNSSQAVVGEKILPTGGATTWNARLPSHIVGHGYRAAGTEICAAIRSVGTSTGWVMAYAQLIIVSL